MDQPGECELTCHPCALGRRCGKAWSRLQPRNPGKYVFVLGIDLDLYPIQRIDVGNERNVGKAERAGQIFSALEFLLKPIKALNDFCPGLLDDFRIPFRLGFTELAVELSAGWVEVAVP